MTDRSQNMFLTGPLGPIFVRTAAPIILIMLINGAYVVADAWFIGHFAGADALSAVTLIFPMSMMMLALQVLVSSGMSSVIARHLGGGRRAEAAAVFGSAHRLSLIMAGLVIALFWTAGVPMIEAAGPQRGTVVLQAIAFMAIMTGAAPIAFILSLQVDALRCEGRLAAMTAFTIGATLLNIALNALFVGFFRWGVTGSAAASVIAQALCLAGIVAHRIRLRSAILSPDLLAGFAEWRQVLALGAPSSLGFLGISLVSGAVIAQVQASGSITMVETIAAYGIMTRALTFTYLPMMGISIAAQTIIGNNIGAGARDRANHGLAIALVAVLVWCGLVELVAILAAEPIGRAFSSDPVVIAETARILPVSVMLYAFVGVPVILSGYFQAIGDAPRAAILGLTRPYLFSLPALFVLPRLLGEPGIWLAAPAADALMLGLTGLVLAHVARTRGWRFGIFQPDGQP